MIAESVDREERGTAYSLISLMWFVPGFYAPVVAGYLAESYGFHPVLAILLATELLAFLIFVALIRETIAVRRSVDLRALIGSFKEAVKPRFGLLRFYGAVIIDGFAWMLEGILFGMLMRAYLLTPLQIGILTNVFCVAMALSQIPMGKLVDRYGRKRLLIASEVTGALAIVGYMLSRGFPELLVCHGLVGVAASAWIPAYQAYISNAVPEGERARFIGDLGALRGLAAFPAPSIGAALFELYGFRGPMLASLGLSITALLMLTMIGER